MSASKFTNRAQAKIAAGVRAGLTFTAACEEAGIPPNTGRTWLRKGRQDVDEAYSAFAAAVEDAQVEFQLEVPEVGDTGDDALPDKDELIRRLDAASKKGNVQATKILLEKRLKRDEELEQGEQLEFDSFDDLDKPVDIRAARSRRTTPAGDAA